MADETRIKDALVALNDALGDVTPYRIDVVAPGDILPVEKNAHYMSKQIYDQLVNNIKEDNNLSSLPFCWRRPDGKYVALSGNHRVQAARDAGTESILILYTDQELTDPERIAIQLSHNAIVGNDNPTVLRELWDRIDILDLKVYSGLDEKMLATMQPVQVVQVSDARLRFENLTLLFVPSEIEQLDAILKRIGQAGKGTKWVTDVEDFDRFFALLLDFKETAEILNTATAFRMIMDIVDQWLVDHQSEAESEAGDGEG